MTVEARTRARSAEDYAARTLGFAAAARRAYAAAPLRQRPTDLFIATYGKCGTTMLQQMFHTLRTGGDMDFDDISRVVPWLEMSPILGLDLNAEQRADPRGFKSHLSYGSLPKGGRYLVSVRDPKDAFISMVHFMEGWMIERGAIPLEDFFEVWAQGGGPEGEGYWAHLLSWWEVRQRPDVLLLSYSKMIRDPVAHVRRLADFVGIALDGALLELTVERSSRAYMLDHKDRFDDLMMRTLSETAGGLPPGSDSAKVCAGSTGDHKAELPPALSDRIDSIWAERVTPVLGYADFAELEAEL
jgi:hypothetical protein